MKTLLTIPETDDCGRLDVAIVERDSEMDQQPYLLSDPIPLTRDRAMQIAHGLIEWAKEQSK